LDFLREPLVVGKLHYLEPRKIALQALAEPFRGNPQFEAVMRCNQQLHWDYLAASGTRRSWPVISLGCGMPSIPRIVGLMSCSAPSALILYCALFSLIMIMVIGLVVFEECGTPCSGSIIISALL